MFFLDPINAITSIQFYKRVAKQTGLRTAAYLGYLSLLFAVAATVALKVRVAPSIDKVFDWLGASWPQMEFSEGRMTSALTAPVTLRYPDVQELAVVIDTARTNAVTPDMLDQAKAMAYLTSNALYVRNQPVAGSPVRAYPFANSNEKFKIDAGFFKSANQIFDRIMYPVAFLLAGLLFLLWRLGASLFYALVGQLVAPSTGASPSFGELFRLAVYAQTFIVSLQIIFLFMHIGIPAGPLVALISTTTYLWLALKAQAPQPAAPAA